MTVFETLMLFAGFATGIIFASLFFYLPIKRLKSRVWKLKKQVYYWSRQIPLVKPTPKRGRPRKSVQL